MNICFLQNNHNCDDQRSNNNNNNNNNNGDTVLVCHLLYMHLVHYHTVLVHVDHQSNNDGVSSAIKSSWDHHSDSSLQSL